jgi:hypothetical protein
MGYDKFGNRDLIDDSASAQNIRSALRAAKHDQFCIASQCGEITLLTYLSYGLSI